MGGGYVKVAARVTGGSTPGNILGGRQTGMHGKTVCETWAWQEKEGGQTVR